MPRLSDLENGARNEFISKLIHAINVNPFAFKKADEIILFAEEEGIFKNVKFGVTKQNKTEEHGKSNQVSSGDDSERLGNPPCRPDETSY